MTSEKDRCVAVRRATVERSKDRIFAARRAIDCSIACIAELHASLARADEVLNRLEATLAAGKSTCIGPMVVAEPDLRDEAQFDLSHRVAAVLRAHGYEFEMTLH